MITLNSKRRQKRRKVLPDRGLLHHSDRGSQYTANHDLKHLKDQGVLVRMSNKADPYDNAMMESFFSTLRAELTDLRDFATRDGARVSLFDFIEVFYNRQRIHSPLATSVQPNMKPVFHPKFLTFTPPPNRVQIKLAPYL